MGFLSDLTWKADNVLHNIGIGGVFDNVAYKAACVKDKISDFSMRNDEDIDYYALQYPHRTFVINSRGLLVDSKTGTCPGTDSFEEECALADYALNVLGESDELVRDTIAVFSETVSYVGEECSASEEEFSRFAQYSGFDEPTTALMLSLAKKLYEYSSRLEDVESYTKKYDDEKADAPKKPESSRRKNTKQVPKTEEAEPVNG